MIISIIIIIIFLISINYNNIIKLIFGSYTQTCDECYINLLTGKKYCDRKNIDPSIEYCTRKDYCDSPGYPFSVREDFSTTNNICENCNCSNVNLCAQNVSSIFVKDKNGFYNTVTNTYKPIKYNNNNEFCRINVTDIKQLYNSNCFGNDENILNADCYTSGYQSINGEKTHIENSLIPCSKGVLVYEYENSNEFIKCVDDVNIDFLKDEVVYYYNNEYSTTPIN